MTHRPIWHDVQSPFCCPVGRARKSTVPAFRSELDHKPWLRWKNIERLLFRQWGKFVTCTFFIGRRLSLPNRAQELRDLSNLTAVAPDQSLPRLEIRMVHKPVFFVADLNARGELRSNV